MSTSEEIELLVLGDIKDVFGTWNDSESSADEVEDSDSTSPPSDLTVPPLRSQTRLSKRTLAQAVSSLPPASGPPAKRRKGALSSTFSPFSSEDYLHRLGSFNLLNFSSSAFPPSAAARAGWSSSGRDRLKCGCCQAAWKISVFTGLKGPVRDKLADRMKEMLRSDHRETCPWRKFGLDIVGREDLSPIPEVKGLSVVEVRTRADAMATHLPEGLQLDHPLSEEDVSMVQSKVRSQPSSSRSSGSASSTATPSSSLPAEILAVFHWQLFSASKTSAVSLSAQTSSPGPFQVSLSETSAAVAPSIPTSQTILSCPLCNRRLGLWTFSAGRRLNVVSSHYPDCPTLTCTPQDRLDALAASSSASRPNPKQMRELVDSLLGPKVTLGEVRQWKKEVDKLQGSATKGPAAI